MIFAEQIRYIDSLEKQFFSSLQKTIRTNSGVIEEYITEDQLFNRGVDGNEKKLLGYARSTIKIKQRKGQPTDRTTLRDTQDFHNSVQVEAKPLELEIIAPVPYTQFLIRRYGPAILKPTKENWMEFFARFFIPELKKDIRL